MSGGGVARAAFMAHSITKTAFGKLPDGSAAELFTLQNAGGLTAKITNYGTIITELRVPDRSGQMADVVLGFDSVEGYVNGWRPYFGCTVGRVANRIANGRFTLDGKTFQLAVNNGPNALHGGLKGFDKVLWKAEPQSGAVLKFRHLSPDGDENYPGNLDVEVVMSLTDRNELVLDYTARTDKPTPVNLTNHSYFNLGGAGSGNILDHILTLAASHYTPSDANLIPTGQVKAVEGTPYDFRRPTPIGARFSQIGGDPSGYDNNFVIDGGGKSLVFAARAHHPGSGRVMETYTTAPAVQLYTANFLDGSLPGKGGKPYGRHAAFCLETQGFPNAVNQPEFPSIILRPGDVYRQTTIYRFSAAA